MISGITPGHENRFCLGRPVSAPFKQEEAVRIRLSYKFFATFFLSFLLIVCSIFGILRLYANRNFADYVNKVELGQLEPLVKKLAEEYDQHKGWALFRYNRHRWWYILTVSGFRVPRPAPPPHHTLPPPLPMEEPTLPMNEPPPAPPDDPFRIGPRLSLYDEYKNPIMGDPGPETEKLVFKAIRVKKNIVGWLGLTKRERLSTPLEAAFLKQQYILFSFIGAGLLLLTTLISFLLSRHILKPIRHLASGTRALNSRKFKTRIEVKSSDELGQLADDFNRMAQTLETYERLRQQWITDISHELRTPLSVLRGEIEALQDGIRKPDARTLDSLHWEIVRISKLVEDLHLLTLTESKTLDLKKERIDPVTVLNRTAELFSARFAEADISLQVDFDIQRPVFIRGDADRLTQLFSNLMENSLRYTDSPGTLRIREERGPDKIILWFEDSGPGVPEESLERIFDRLFRVDRSRSRKLGGSGLGLAICKQIVETHEGTVQAGKSAEKGLSIRIEFPISRQKNSLLSV